MYRCRDNLQRFTANIWSVDAGPKQAFDSPVSNDANGHSSEGGMATAGAMGDGAAAAAAAAELHVAADAATAALAR